MDFPGVPTLANSVSSLLESCLTITFKSTLRVCAVRVSWACVRALTFVYIFANCFIFIQNLSETIHTEATIVAIHLLTSSSARTRVAYLLALIHFYTSTIIRLLKIQMTSAVWILGILGINNTEGVRVTMVFFWTGKRGFAIKSSPYCVSPAMALFSMAYGIFMAVARLGTLI